MKILVASATAKASTGLAAFDKALNKVGLDNYNLIRLSSVIPPGAKVVVNKGKIKTKDLSGGWGDRLYVVMAELRTITPNTEAWAGMGWVQDKNTGKGLFVEHEGFSKNSVKDSINDSLESMMKYRKDCDFGSIKTEICGIACEDHPVSALVIAAYQTSGWDDTAAKS
ncbi:MAG: pyruvoyl-dependent arginine decarboxylase [Candidatus Saccharimonadales bacterium]